ncbi:MAG TPA: D-glycero-beta-D-manno-heptose 1,7-bisphosphate 7-phosphatase [Chloroflexota bacterium]|nr:D-glycero-beta-D-manno-heptose 1,7-bisphosphate 7-phosphatase [Chloroflexota bacterium]
MAKREQMRAHLGRVADSEGRVPGSGGQGAEGERRLRAAVFLDRDGVINENLDGTYVQSWETFRFLPRSVEAIAHLHRAGWPVVVVTNQAGVGKGVMTESALGEIHRRMLGEVEEAGGKIEAVMYCPHRSEEGCACRKPQPGLLRQAAAELGLDLDRSVFVGDNITDVEAARAAGCRAILVLTGRGAGSRAAVASLEGVEVVQDVAEAVERILGGRRS